MGKNSHVYTVTHVNGPTYEDTPYIEFDNILNLVSHIQATYPDHASYVVIAATKAKAVIPHRTITRS